LVSRPDLSAGDGTLLVELTELVLNPVVGGDWELVFYNEETDNIRDTFRKNFLKFMTYGAVNLVTYYTVASMCRPLHL
jgi:hypothetical protein